jgi:hypothetical protein
MGGWRGPKPAYAVAFDSCSSSLKRPASVGADAERLRFSATISTRWSATSIACRTGPSRCARCGDGPSTTALGGTAAGVALDWAIKHRIYTHRLAKHGLSWNTLDAWNRVINRSWHLHGHSGERFTIETALEPRTMARALSRIRWVAERRGLD